MGALFGLLFTGYSIYYLPFNWFALAVILIGSVFFFRAVRLSQKQPLLWLALAILFFEIGSAFLFHSEVWWQPAVNPILAILVIVLTSLFLWYVARKGIEAYLLPPRQDLAALIGQSGEAKTVVGREGSVQVSGELWSACSESGEAIAAGTTVCVVRREGFVLVVKAL